MIKYIGIIILYSQFWIRIFRYLLHFHRSSPLLLSVDHILGNIDNNNM